MSSVLRTSCFFNIAQTSATVPLFDKLVYGREIWGIYNYNEVDKLHIRFCMMVLGVKKQTVNDAVLGELGRLPLSRTAKFRSIKYWLNIQDTNNPNTQLQQIYNQQCEDITIDELGLSDLWF